MHRDLAYEEYLDAIPPITPADLDRMEYEQRPYSVFCDICGIEAYAPERTLRANGWLLGNGMEICGNHE